MPEQVTSPESQAQQDFDETFSLLRSIREASIVSPAEASDAFRTTLSGYYNEVSEINEGRSILAHRRGTTVDVAKAAEKYEATISRVREFGHVPKETMSSFRATFDTSAKDDYRNASPWGVPGGPIQRDPLGTTNRFIEMRVHDGDKSHGELFDQLHDVFDFDEDTRKRLGWIATDTSGSHHPAFPVRHSPPLLQVLEAADGTLSAMLGVTTTHLYRPRNRYNHITTDATSVSLNAAQEFIKARLGEFETQRWLQANAAQHAPDAEHITQDALEEAEALRTRFIAQLRSEAPELDIFDDAHLRELLHRSHDDFYGRLLASNELSAAERHAALMIRKGGTFSVYYKNGQDGEAMSLYGRLVRFWEPTSFLSANGRTGLVTRTDYEDDPGHVASVGKKIGEETYDAETSRTLRQRMFDEAVLQRTES